MGVFVHTANAAITVVSVDDIVTSVGSDSFGLRDGNEGSAFFFGNGDLVERHSTAFRIDLLNDVHYFQANTDIPASLLGTSSYSFAYVFASQPNAGAVPGENFSIYDINQDGVHDTVFRLNFGENLLDQSDDLIISYAFDDALSGIDVVAARAALIPEPSVTILLGVGISCLGSIRRRQNYRCRTKRRS